MVQGENNEYISIPIETVVVDTLLDFDLYLLNNIVGKHVLYRSRNTEFQDETREVLMGNKVYHLFIKGEDKKQYDTYVEKNLSRIISSRSMPVDEKVRVIYDSATNLMEEVFIKPESDESMKRSRGFVKNTVRFILKEKHCFYDIINLTSHDYYTYTHSINVCMYALTLAKAYGITSSLELGVLGTGAILHDVGKSKIPLEVLNKKGALDDDEWKLIQGHPLKGEDILKEQNLDREILDIVRHHHEKLDGTGYPDRLSGEDINVLVRIVTIADIFDALNTKRSYKDAASTFNSIQIMINEFPGKLDQELLKVFIKLFRANKLKAKN